MARRLKPAVAKKPEAISVYFATNRNEDDDAIYGGGFNVAGPSELRFGSAEVTGRKLEKRNVHICKENLAAEEPVLGSAEVFSKLRASMKTKERDTVFFVHGFNYTFEDAILGAADLKRNFDSVERNWIIFTWPSDGSMEFIRAYKSDRIDAEASGTAMARGILKAAEFLRRIAAEERCKQRIHLIAHSMGNYVLRHAVQKMHMVVGKKLPRLFDEIILLAADEDDDALELDYKLGPLQQLGRRTTVYYNMQDIALKISDLTKGNINRLGDIGPRNPSALPANFTLVNASAAGASDAKTDATRHQYYYVNSDVRRDILAVLEGKDDASIAIELRMRTWRPEGLYWRLDSAQSKPKKASRPTNQRRKR